MTKTIEPSAIQRTLASGRTVWVTNLPNYKGHVIDADHAQALLAWDGDGRPCGRCGGKGYIRGFEHVMQGICFGCWGTARDLTPEEAERLKAERHKAIDPRVAAIRADRTIGHGSCSVVDECWEDAELVEHLDGKNITDPADAVRELRFMHDVWADVSADIAASAY